MMAMSRLNTQNLIWLGICVAGVLTFLLVFVYPNAMAMNDLDEQAADLERQVQEQELLHPIYLALIRQVQQGAAHQMPDPGRSRVDRTTINDIHGVFASMAAEAGVVFDSAVPDPVSYLEESRHLTMNVAFSGDFFNFRELLVRICQLPYLDAIEQLQIRTDGDTKRLRLKLQLNQA